MRYLKQVLGHKNFKHAKHPLIKLHAHKKHQKHIKGSGTPAHKKDYSGSGFGPERGVRGPLKPLKFKF